MVTVPSTIRDTEGLRRIYYPTRKYLRDHHRKRPRHVH